MFVFFPVIFLSLLLLLFFYENSDLFIHGIKYFGVKKECNENLVLSLQK